ncbi:hypothetical protein X945_5801 [Burkholderia pseudomallei ABCPW 107]|nr:hypothetical protein X945_5801 [Burkholderia pseudomallei ABCPW 107]
MRDELAQVARVGDEPVLHVGSALRARERGRQCAQPAVAHEAVELVAVREAVVRVARAEVQVHRAARGVVPDEADQRADAGARADQDHRRRARVRTQARMRANERLDRVARLQAGQIARAHAVRMAAHADLDDAVRRGACERVVARRSFARRHDAEQIAGFERRQPPPRERRPPCGPPAGILEPFFAFLTSFTPIAFIVFITSGPVRAAGAAISPGGREAQHRRHRSRIAAVVVALDERERHRARQRRRMADVEREPERIAEPRAPRAEFGLRLPVDGAEIEQRCQAFRDERVMDASRVAAKPRKLAIAETEHRE